MTEAKPFSENALRRIAQIIERKYDDQQNDNNSTGIAQLFDTYHPNIRNIQRFLRRAGFPNEYTMYDGEEDTLWTLVNIQKQSDGKDKIIRIIEQLCNPEEYFDDPENHKDVEEEINKVLYRYNLKVQFGKITPVDLADRLIRASKKQAKDYVKIKESVRNDKADEQVHEDNEHRPVLYIENALSNIEFIARQFHLVARQLTQRHNNRSTIIIEDEYDVQDLFHGLLKLFFTNIRREEGTTSYAGKNSRIDFLLKNEQIAIEIKHTRKGLADKKLGEELTLDKDYYYHSHPECKAFVAFIYDPEKHINNPEVLENDLSREINEMLVRVFINQS